jgi:predicted dienelactone hydrolase
MSRRLTFLSVVIALIGLAAAWFWFTGLPLRKVLPPAIGLVGASSDSAIDPARSEFFAKDGARVVPFQILYPASAPGRTVAYVPDAEPVVAAVKRTQGRLVGLALARIGRIAAPWTDGARPWTGGPYPVVVNLPGVTGYMQMSSFQTTALAADGFVVVTLNQPGAVAAALLPDGRVIEGMSRDEAVRLVTPSYRHSPLSSAVAARLAPERSIVPYLAADVPAVIDRLSAINADPRHPLHGLLDLQRIGVMGVSLGAIVAAQACHSYDRIKACLMLDAPVPIVVADAGLRKPALWLNRPAADQRAERAASGGWPEPEIEAQAASIARAVSNSSEARVVQLNGLFHVDFTDVPTIQPIVGWTGMAGPIGTTQAHREITALTVGFFRQMKTRQAGRQTRSSRTRTGQANSRRHPGEGRDP